MRSFFSSHNLRTSSHNLRSSSHNLRSSWASTSNHRANGHLAGPWGRLLGGGRSPLMGISLRAKMETDMHRTVRTTPLSHLAVIIGTICIYAWFAWSFAKWIGNA